MMDTRRADHIAETLQQLVFSGAFRDGERLDELKLAERFKVSRTPIREALQVLVSTGIAEQIPRRGVFIRKPGAVELMDMFETMAEIEGICGRLATTRMTEGDLDALDAANERCREATLSRDHDRYYTENEVFHQVIYQGAANSFLEKQAVQLQNRLRPYRRMQLRFRGRLEQSMQEHSQILKSLKEGAGDIAATALRNHVAVQGEKFHQLIATLDRD